MVKWLGLPAVDHGEAGSSHPKLNSILLQRAFHSHIPIVLILLKYCFQVIHLSFGYGKVYKFCKFLLAYMK